MGALRFNQRLSSWALKTSDSVNTTSMLSKTGCPSCVDDKECYTPDPEVGPWCQKKGFDGCVASSTSPNVSPTVPVRSSPGPSSGPSPGPSTGPSGPSPGPSLRLCEDDKKIKFI